MYIAGDTIAPTFHRSLFKLNTAEDNGGGVYISGAASARFDVCTWLANGAAKRGGGLVVYASAGDGTLMSPTFNSCIFEHNHAGKNGGDVGESGWQATDWCKLHRHC